VIASVCASLEAVDCQPRFHGVFVLRRSLFLGSEVIIETAKDRATADA
jgi:hypothetical protein